MGQPAKRPNILWVCSDQQRFDSLGCYGNHFVRTPNLDRLAAGGILFEHAYSQSPVCTPSRASFLTGRYPRTTRCRQNGQSIPAEEVLVTKLLREAGHVCGLSGKLHLSPCHPSACPGGERRIDDGYDQFFWSHHPAHDWPVNEYGQWALQQGAVREAPLTDCTYLTPGVPPQHHQTTWCIDKAIAFIEGCAPHDRPWLFSVNMFDPHHPFDPPRDYLERYLKDLDDIPLPNYTPGELDHKPRWQQVDHEGAYAGTGGFAYERMTPRDHRLVRAAYWAMVDLIDAQMGRLLGALEACGQLENTLVIFTSDHGEFLGDHGMYLKGPHFYDPSVRVPLIISWPGVIAPGQRSPALVELADLAPTVLKACGLAPHSGMQSQSLWSLLNGAAPIGRFRDDVYCEYYNACMPHDPPAHATMLRTAEHKLVVAHGSEPGELYDLQDDPAETHNEWDNPALQAVKADLLQRLCDRMAWTVDPLPRREAPW